jgi:hypothetical protein
MTKKFYLIIFMVLSLTFSACKFRTIDLTSPFDVATAERLMQQGNNTIVVNSFMRQMAGGIVNCGGFNVLLIPVTNTSQEIVTAIFKNPNGGCVNPIYFDSFEVKNQDEAYKKYIFTKTCNSEGYVTFENITDGEFYVVSTIIWQLPFGYYLTSTEGGVMYKRVSVSGGQKLDVIITNIN